VYKATIISTGPWLEKKPLNEYEETQIKESLLPWRDCDTGLPTRWVCRAVERSWREKFPAKRIRFVAWDGAPPGKSYRVELLPDPEGDDWKEEYTDCNILVDGEPWECYGEFLDFIERALEQEGLPEVYVTLEKENEDGNS